MVNFFDRCKSCSQYGQCVFADTAMSCAWDVIARDSLGTIKKESARKGNGRMRKDCCGNCMYFNGDIGDGDQFCDERETYVHEEGYCYRHVRKNPDEECE